MKWFLMIMALTALVSLLPSEVISMQGFEGDSQDTWLYSANDIPVGYWGIIDDSFGGADPQSGYQYWASWNLGNNEGNLTFENQNLPMGYLYQIRFFYYTRLLNYPSEYCDYSISFDGGISWSQPTDHLPNTQVWTEVIIDIPASERQIMLKVSTKHSGTSKYVHWDSFSLNRTEVPPSAPFISNIVATQRTDGSGLVDIYYDYFDANGDSSDISMLVSDNEGSTFSITPTLGYLSGDIGSNITIGNNKHIVWDVGSENLSFEGDQYRFRFIAEDGTTFGTIDTPVYNPPAGTYIVGQPVSITCSLDGAIMYYTTDGSEPTESSTQYMSPITLMNNMIFKVKAYKSQWLASTTATANYTVVPTNFVFVQVDPLSGVADRSYYIDKFELTVSEWNAIMGGGAGSSYPKTSVNLYGMIEYCNKRSIAEGITPCYSYGVYGTNPSNWPSGWNTTDSNAENLNCDLTAIGYRLPTWNEWFFAAQGGMYTQNYIYSGSNDLNSVAWYYGNSGGNVKQVATKQPNELGIHDMSGNVWEMIWAIWVDQVRRMVGGAVGFNNPAVFQVRNIAYDAGRAPTATMTDLGFRICRSVQQ